MKIKKFKGMNNIKRAEGDPREPSVVLNSYVTPQGRVLKKEGYIPFASLARVHSLHGGSVMLAVADDKLYRIDGGIATELCIVRTHGSDMSYVKANSKIYMSCAGWTGVYDLISSTVKDWGLKIPDAPIIEGIAGDLPPGTYSVCYTNIDSNGMAGGSSSPVKFTFENQSMGISLINPPSNTLTWLTDTNTDDFYLAGNTDNVTRITSPHNALPLPSLNVMSPPKMTSIFLAFGRIWGVAEKKLYYSEPSVFEWFKNANSFTFQEQLVVAGYLTSGIFVSSKSSTWVLTGTNPREMTLHRVGDGAIEGTLTYADIQTQGITSKCPVWMGPDGFTMLNDQFSLESLSNTKIAIPISDKGCSIEVARDGIKQIITSLKIPKNMTTDLGAVFEEGRLSRTNITGSGGIVVTT